MALAEVPERLCESRIDIPEIRRKRSFCGAVAISCCAGCGVALCERHAFVCEECASPFCVHCDHLCSGSLIASQKSGGIRREPDAQPTPHPRLRQMHVWRSQAWARAYEAALLELDPIKLSVLIWDAQAAIRQRTRELLRHRQADPSEKVALRNAMSVLTDLRRIAGLEGCPAERAS